MKISCRSNSFMNNQDMALILNGQCRHWMLIGKNKVLSISGKMAVDRVELILFYYISFSALRLRQGSKLPSAPFRRRYWFLDRQDRNLRSRRDSNTIRMQINRIVEIIFCTGYIFTSIVLYGICGFLYSKSINLVIFFPALWTNLGKIYILSMISRHLKRVECAFIDYIFIKIENDSLPTLANPATMMKVVKVI